MFDYVIEKDYLDEAEATYYMKQILEGLAYVHKKSIVHLDMKVQRGAESGGYEGTEGCRILGVTWWCKHQTHCSHCF